ncbi:protein spire isoform X1 [Schistocerca serialis cubense]|uniref:protein spire isoform X1 n=1 Tax=Schistocerca serialis cubense TaxID=2023355 RepID=UPI00214EBBB2|nr:protein spire isoform X1 [Schistocerca serialis cubense]
MAADVKVTPKCSLDANSCVSLLDILISFNAPINEQHAWALCYQCAKSFKNAMPGDKGKCYYVTELEHVLLHKDGYVHPNTIFAGGGPNDTGPPSSRVPVSSELQVVFHLGLIIYRALDFGLNEREERHLSPDLEALIDMMTESAQERQQQETDDEGIERDSADSEDDVDAAVSGDRGRVSLSTVIQRCISHVGAPSAQQADQHYRAVCRALVAEAIELSQFLEKVSQGTRELRATAEAASTDLDMLRFSDWTGLRMWRVLQARLWVQVIHELRHGVKLKKVNYSRGPIEYELTPYEMLMEDIRSRRYKLNKVMVDGDIPHRVKKDAHAIILEFIRSRPPLRKASERKLPPPRSRQCTPRELLMESIKRGCHLRPSLSHLKKRIIPVESPQGNKEEPVANGNAKNTRRLIKVDFSVLQSDDDDDDEDDVDVTSPTRNGGPTPASSTAATKGSSSGEGRRHPWHRTGILTHHEYHSYMDSALESYDLATQCPSRRASMRRHTIVVCNPQQQQLAAEAGLGSQSVPHSRPQSRGPTPSSASSEAGTDTGMLGLGNTLPEMSWSRSSLQDELLHSKNWQQAMECLSLTLEEIVHIRSVLTKAELESLPVEGHVKEDVEKRKVCFLCLKTRFGIFGPWGQLCKLCKRTVCAKCYSKMRIPTEHFSRVPVFALSPGLSSPEEETKESFPRSLMSRLMVPDTAARNSVGSAPSSPHLTRGESMSAPPSAMSSSMTGSIEGPQSLPAMSPASTASERRSMLSRSKTLGRPETKKDKLKGLQMTVCHDCKTMVIQIIKSSRTSRNNAIRHLTLNLSPVY